MNTTILVNGTNVTVKEYTRVVGAAPGTNVLGMYTCTVPVNSGIVAQLVTRLTADPGVAGSRVRFRPGPAPYFRGD